MKQSLAQPSILYLTAGMNNFDGSSVMSKPILDGILTVGLKTVVVTPEKPRQLSPVQIRFQNNLSWLEPPQDAKPLNFQKRDVLRQLVRQCLARGTFGAKQKKVRDLRGSLLVANGFGSDPLVRHLAPDAADKSVLIVHDSPTKYCLPGYPPLDWAMDIMQNYERFIFVSETVRREWQAIPEIAARNGCVIPNCCREEQIAVVWAQSREELRKRLGFRAETFVIVCVASVQYLKGQDLLVQAFNALQAADKQQTKNSVLVLVGQPSSVVGTDWGETFVQSVAASPQADRIKLMGARVDALDFLRAADVMVLPSRSEVMPVTILEAMALGTPVVASSVGGIPELIEHDRTGLLAAPNSVEELTEALTAMQANPEQRQRFTLAAQEKYRTQFSQYCLTTRYAEVLKQFLCGEEWA